MTTELGPWALEDTSLAQLDILLHVMCLQGTDPSEYVEFPLLFTIQNEGLSALLDYNLDAANSTSGRTFNVSDPDFQVCHFSLSSKPTLAPGLTPVARVFFTNPS